MLALYVLLGIVALAALLGLYATFIEPRWLRVRRRIVHLPGLPQAFDGFTILHISDLHLRPRRTQVERFLDRAQAIASDLIVVTGDFIEGPSALPRLAPAMRRLTHGRRVLGILGNHEHSHYLARIRIGARGWERRTPLDRPRVMEALREGGLELLINERVTVSRGGGELTFVGLDDLYHQAADPSLALGGVGDLSSVVLLCHSPDILPYASRRGIPLVLSGHTHGGQVQVPFIGALYTATRLPFRRGYGLFRTGRTLMHIHPGLGLGVLPLRFLVRPEITLLELRRGEA